MAAPSWLLITTVHVTPPSSSREQRKAEKRAWGENDVPAKKKIPKYSRIGMEGKGIYVIALLYPLVSRSRISGGAEDGTSDAVPIRPSWFWGKSTDLHFQSGSCPRRSDLSQRCCMSLITSRIAVWHGNGGLIGRSFCILFSQLSAPFIIASPKGEREEEWYVCKHAEKTK